MTTRMETEDKDAAAQAGPKGSTSGLNISLHPLVIINISDHATRKKALSGGRPQRVLGILLGVQVGKIVGLLDEKYAVYFLFM
jgi:COP9 signalosome complex subunit 6